MIFGTDLSVLFNPFVSGGAVVIVAVILGVPWLSRRYIFRELNHDTGFTRDRPIALFAPGREDNPPLTYFLELLYTNRFESVLMLHRVGALVSLRDGSMIMHGRDGRILTHMSSVDGERYRRRLGAGAPQPPV